MSLANPRWGAPRIHGELLKIGIAVSQATVAKYMVRHRKPPSQTWRTFLKNHAKGLVSAGFFVVPTITFQLLFVFVILDHDLSFAKTSHGPNLMHVTCYISTLYVAHFKRGHNFGEAQVQIESLCRRGK
jgi:hypothetical protein